MKKKAKKLQSNLTAPDASAADPALTQGVAETTADYLNNIEDAREEEFNEPPYEEPDGLPYTVSDIDFVFKKLLRLDQDKRDPLLWEDDSTNARLLSDVILGPIKQALRRCGYLQVNAPTSDGPPSDEGMKGLFRENLDPLEHTLGRLVLEAIIGGDRQFVACVDAALKDSDALFHRGTMNDAFFRWKREFSEDELRKFTTAEVQRRFEKAYRILNWDEWTALKKTFHLDFLRFSEPRRGRPRRRQRAKSRRISFRRNTGFILKNVLPIQDCPLPSMSRCNAREHYAKQRRGPIAALLF